MAGGEAERNYGDRNQPIDQEEGGTEIDRELRNQALIRQTEKKKKIEYLKLGQKKNKINDCILLEMYYCISYFFDIGSSVS